MHIKVKLLLVTNYAFCDLHRASAWLETGTDHALLKMVSVTPSLSKEINAKEIGRIECCNLEL
jgi:hypothetical protein